MVEEGLNGRTTRWDDPIEPGRNGLTYLRPCIESHQPLDLIVIMLGTNDLKRRFDLSASDIAAGRRSAELAWRFTTRRWIACEVLLVAPPAVTTLTEFDQMFDGACEKSRRFSHYYRLAAGWHHLPFFDAGSVIVSSEKDGIHSTRRNIASSAKRWLTRCAGSPIRTWRRRHRFGARDHD